MQQEHERILSIMAESGAENIVLFYNTNGTIYEEKFFDLWKKFKTVRINFSIDDVEDRFEYQRKNAKWDEVLANIEKYMTLGKQTSKFEFSIYCTVSTFNVFYIKEFVEKLAHLNIDFWFNIVHFPNHFSIKELPLNVKTKIKEKINTIDLSNVKIHRDSISINDVVNFMMDTQDLSESFLKGLDKIKLHDEYRKESFKDIFPELFDLYNSSL
jgi:MoaA/NifB/PqqE/SkfB family radical SAM enzyme